MDADKRSLARLTATVLAGLALATPGALAESPPAQAVRVGAAAALPAGAQPLGAVPAEKPLKLTVALASQDPSGLAELASEVSDPSSPRFRQYLSVAQFARRFGATPAQTTAVREALREHGLSVGAPTANDLTLPVSGTAAQVEQAFATSLSQVELPDGRMAYANTDAPAVSASVAPFVQGVIGLDDVGRDAPQDVTSRSLVRRSVGAPAHSASGGARNVQVATGGPQPCEAAQALQEPFEFAAGQRAAGVTADQVATAYRLSGMYRAGDFGAGQTIALFEQEAFLPSDIASYQSCFGTSATVTPIDVDGGPEASEEGDAEAALDIEQVMGLAPQAHVLVYQGPIEQNVAPVDIIARIVSDDSAKVISTSWGICEELTGSSVIAAENTLLQEAAAQGQSFFSASGDSGSEQCSQYKASDKSISVLNPASQPFATGVGGTTLFSRDEGAAFFYTGELPPSESVWNDRPPPSAKYEFHGATGGGISQRWAMPAYQSSAAPTVGVVKAGLSGGSCGGAALCREVPDVAANADSRTGYVVFADIEEEDGWTFVGGTSAAAPLWAAVTGLANASPACHGLSIGFANPSLYALAGSAYESDFRDISSEHLHRQGEQRRNVRSRPVPGLGEVRHDDGHRRAARDEPCRRALCPGERPSGDRSGSSGAGQRSARRLRAYAGPGADVRRVRERRRGAAESAADRAPHALRPVRKDGIAAREGRLRARLPSTRGRLADDRLVRVAPRREADQAEAGARRDRPAEVLLRRHEDARAEAHSRRQVAAEARQAREADRKGHVRAERQAGRQRGEVLHAQTLSATSGRALAHLRTRATLACVSVASTGAPYAAWTASTSA